MILRRTAKLTIAVLFVSAAGLSDAATARSPNPVNFIQNLADQAIRVLSSRDGTLQEREDKFRTILRDDFAMERIGRFVVGAYWRKMNADQKKTYQKLFSEWVLKTYSTRLGGYSGEQFTVLRTAPASKRDTIVYTRIEKPGGGGFNCNWRVRKVGDRYKIIDIYVEGVSMAITQRSEFDSVLRKRGIDGLIGLIRDRLIKLSAAS